MSLGPVEKRKLGLAATMIVLMVLIISFGTYFEEKLKIATLTQNNISNFNYYKIENSISYGLPEPWINSESNVINDKIKYRSEFVSDDNIVRGFVELWQESEDILSMTKENEKNLEKMNIDDYKTKKFNKGNLKGYSTKYKIQLENDSIYRKFDYIFDLNGNKMIVSFYIKDANYRENSSVVFENILNTFEGN